MTKLHDVTINAGTMVNIMNNKSNQDKNEKIQRLPAKQLHRIICEALEEALKPNSTVPADENGFVSTDVLADIIVYRQEKELPQSEAYKYTGYYRPSELISKGINIALARLGKQIETNKKSKPYSYRGYIGITQDYINSSVIHNQTPVDKEVFDFIKGTMNFETLSAIRNRIKTVADKAWKAYCVEHPKAAKNKVIEKSVKDQYKPDGPFICIEGSIYEFAPEYKEMTEHEREMLLLFADAIIYKKAVEVTYHAFHYDKPDQLEFHPHYIRKVGNKLMVYGRSRSIKYHKPDEYTLVNLIVQRVKAVQDFSTPKHYYSAKELNLDYNNELFRNRMTFNAPGYNSEHFDCKEVVLKVRKHIETGRKPRKPFDRMLAEPLHHSQKVCTKYPEDEQFGYLSLFVSDYLFIRPILMAWGSDVQVIEPQELRIQMEQEICRLVELYGIQFTYEPVQQEPQD